MPQQGMRELVGRAMLDPDFLAELVRSPDVALTPFSLDDNERAVVMRAVARMASRPPNERAREFQSATVRRVAT